MSVKKLDINCALAEIWAQFAIWESDTYLNDPFLLSEWRFSSPNSKFARVLCNMLGNAELTRLKKNEKSLGKT